MSDKLVSVLVVDDHPVVRRGIEVLIKLEPKLYLKRDLGSYQETLDYLGSCQVLPNVAVIDLSLKDGNGIELIRIINQKYQSINILVLSMHEESVFISQCLRAGARGYIMKSSPPFKFIQAIKSVASGELWLSEEVAKSLLNKQYDLQKKVKDKFSKREKEVLRLMAMGYKSADIAASLGISVKTINTHKENLKNKLGLSSIEQLIAYACNNQ